ncbi:MAG: folate-binding protein [Betaproteobacteria bacterium]
MTNTNTSWISPLPDWHLIHVSGSDCVTFLQNLFTNNILNLTIKDQQLSGFCSSKGRLIASFWISNPKKECYDLWISADLVEDFTKKLTMYRLRSKVIIELAPSEVKVYGQISQDPWCTYENIQCNLPKVIFENKEYHRRLIATTAEFYPIGVQHLWKLLEVQSGIPRITDQTKDLFVPQMINFESVGAVDFKKGCYPGQEIVARSQYLGTIKRRLKIAYLNILDNQEITIMPGLEIFSEANPGQACGIVVLSCIDKPNNRYCFQVEVKLSEIKEDLYFFMNGSKYSDIVLVEPPYPLITF